MTTMMMRVCFNLGGCVGGRRACCMSVPGRPLSYTQCVRFCVNLLIHLGFVEYYIDYDNTKRL